MEKSRIRPVPAGKSVRMSYSRQKEVLEMPNLIEIHARRISSGSIGRSGSPMVGFG